MSINRCLIGGNITHDLDLKKTPNGVSVLTVDVAVNRDGKDAGSDFIRCVVWRQSAEFLYKYAKKGTMIFVDGRLQKRKYESNGRTEYVTEVVADRVQILRQPQGKIENELQFDIGSPIEIDSDELPF